MYNRKREWHKLVRLGYGHDYQYHPPPLKNREIYEGGMETIQILREALVGMTKAMMMNYFAESSEHSRDLSEKGKDRFWLRFCKSSSGKSSSGKWMYPARSNRYG